MDLISLAQATETGVTVGAELAKYGPIGVGLLAVGYALVKVYNNDQTFKKDVLDQSRADLASAKEEIATSAVAKVKLADAVNDLTSRVGKLEEAVNANTHTGRATCPTLPTLPET